MEVPSDRIKIAAGTKQLWMRIEIFNSASTAFATLDRDIVSSESIGETTLTELRTMIWRKYPVKARQWLQNYFNTVHVIHTFNIFPDRMNKDDWVLLGGVQNILKYSLRGIKQVDKEGFYNESGDYILYQMYENANGSNVVVVTILTKLHKKAQGGALVKPHF
ncbi:MAG: hypothetical protein ABSF79_12760 [Smithellaceae bacterium]|jgi:hypothetical protein